MALKDLVAQSSALAEDAIEKIIKDYVRYDPEAEEIAFTPEFAALGNKAKVLVYLVALQGWGFVTDVPIETPTKPADIGEKLGIHGGTLRPLLKDLKDGHLVNSKGAEYSVRAASLAAIERELSRSPTDGNRGAKPRKSGKTKRAKTTPTQKPKSPSADNEPTKMDKRKRRGGAGIKDAFDQWVEEGFFDDEKTLAQVQARFHEEAIIIPRTSIPGYLLGAVRSKALSRRKQDVNGKKIWVYQSK